MRDRQESTTTVATIATSEAEEIGVQDDPMMGGAVLVAHADIAPDSVVRAGRITLQEALRQISGETDDARKRQVRSVGRRLNALLRAPDLHPDFLSRLQAFLDHFGPGAG